jgi:hypothetical protein
MIHFEAKKVKSKKKGTKDVYEKKTKVFNS